MFNNKKDPLLDSVNKVMKENQLRREAEEAVNKSFGITSARALPHEKLPEYEATLRAATAKVLTEGTVALDEISKDLASRYRKKANADISRQREKMKSAENTMFNTKSWDSENKKARTEYIQHRKVKDKRTAGVKMVIAKKKGTAKVNVKESILDEVKEEIKNHLIKQLHEAERQGAEATQSFVDSLTEEQAEILGFNEQAVEPQKPLDALVTKGWNAVKKWAQSTPNLQGLGKKIRQDNAPSANPYTPPPRPVRPKGETPAPTMKASRPGATAGERTQNTLGATSGVKPVSKGTTAGKAVVPNALTRLKSVQAQRSTVRAVNPPQTQPGSGAMNKAADSAATPPVPSVVPTAKTPAVQSDAPAIKATPVRADAPQQPSAKQASPVATANPANRPAPAAKPESAAPKSPSSSSAPARPAATAKSSSPKKSDGGSFSGHPDWAKKAFNPDSGA